MTEHGRVALVTGASSGMGRATAEAFVSRGYATVLVDRDVEAGKRAEEELRGEKEADRMASWARPVRRRRSRVK